MKRQSGLQRSGGSSMRMANPVEIVIFSICVYFSTTPFLFILTKQNPNVQMVLNLSTMQQEAISLQLVYLMRAFIGIAGLVFMVAHLRDVKAHSRALLPLIPFLLWALASTFWSDNGGMTIRSLLTLVVLWMGAYLMALRLSPVNIARAFVLGGAIMGITCLAYALVDPVYAVHQLSDSMQSVHAGAWRGVYQHKNFLGHIAAFFAVAIFWADGKKVLWYPIKWAVIALLLFLVMMSTSASALPIFIMSIALVWISIIASPKARTRALVIFAPALVALYWATSMVLDALGRDLSLTGRTEVWAIAIDTIMSRPLQGYGYMSISYGDFSYNLVRQLGLMDPHSGYFELLLGTGIVGLLSFLFILFSAWKAARRLYLADGGERQAALVLSSIVIGWLISCVTESSSRPLSAMGGIGLFALVTLISIPLPSMRSAAVTGTSAAIASLRAKMQSN